MPGAEEPDAKSIPLESHIAETLMEATPANASEAGFAEDSEPEDAAEVANADPYMAGFNGEALRPIFSF